MDPAAFYRLTEIDQTTWPEIREQILRFDFHGADIEPRSYPGYPRWPLPRVRSRLWPPLDRVLVGRRTKRNLSTDFPDSKTLSRWLFFSHGIQANDYRGPAPSSGGLQALELYLVALSPGWLPMGLYHYERAGHALAQIAAGVEAIAWPRIVPSLPLVTGGSLLWVLVGDGRRVQAKYGPRGLRFLLLESGHLMQNLCVVAASLGWATTPLGGFLEGEVARVFQLPATDVVLYLGVAGRPVRD